MAWSHPLVVDLDGTLTPCDTLMEAIVSVVLRRPKHVFAMLTAALQGVPALRAFLATSEICHPDVLPLRDRLLQYLRQQKAEGRTLVLATAAPQPVAEAISEKIGIFDRVIGSRSDIELKGAAKRGLLEREFPEGFAYAGNDQSDLEVWRAAKSIVVVAAPATIAQQARELGIPVEREFAENSPGVASWTRALRLHQWAKNLLIFVPLIVGHRYGDIDAIRRVVLGFVALSAAASATYLVNDMSDLAADRHHPSKKDRPIAQGVIPIRHALAAAAALAFAGTALAFLIDARFGGLLIGYVLLTLAYSMRLRERVLIDVFVLGLLYTLRIFMGMVLISSDVLNWLLVFSLFFFYSLSMAKRHVEIVRAAASGYAGRIGGRGYLTEDAPLTLALGTASGIAAVVVMFEYVANQGYPANFYNAPHWLWLISFIVFLWLTRIWLKSHRGRLDDDPVIFALKDPASQFLGLLVLICFGLAML